MRIRVDDIKDKGLSLEFVEAPDELPGLADLSEAEDARFAAPVRLSGRAIRVGEVVEVEGKVNTSVRLTCSRCLKEFEAPLNATFALTFAREVPRIEDESGEEVELSADDLGLIVFEGDEIDLKEAVAEQVIMNLPLQPLCETECRGLCPQCGADLNQGQCDCAPPEFRNRFAALKDFKVDKKK